MSYELNEDARVMYPVPGSAILTSLPSSEPFSLDFPDFTGYVVELGLDEHS